MKTKVGDGDSSQSAKFATATFLNTLGDQIRLRRPHKLPHVRHREIIEKQPATENGDVHPMEAAMFCNATILKTYRLQILQQQS